jgi:60 kDa SS-A/Ro ribonucleoprotein
MANARLFKSMMGKLLPNTNGKNHEGANAYVLTPQHALAQYAMTGCLNGTFYSAAEVQLSDVLTMASDVDDEFLAKLAVYSREKGAMKDMPVMLLAILAARQSAYLAPAFARVVDNGKMLRNFVQIVRSGATGRKSLGSRPKRLVQAWLTEASTARLLQASVGNDPSLADVVKMVHPQPKDAEQAAVFAWLIGKPFDVNALPQVIQDYELVKRGVSADLPNVPFQMLTHLTLSTAQWSSIAKNMGWQALRINLNTLLRHGVFDNANMVTFVAQRLRDHNSIRKAQAFPYQLLMAYQAAQKEMPAAIGEALQDALEHSLVNVPTLAGKKVVVCPDVSGSMQSPVTGFRKGATTSVRCIDVAGLVAAAMLRNNPQTTVLPFENNVVDIRLNSRDSVMTNARQLASIGGGGTNCSAPLAWLNQHKAAVDIVIFVSDNESWVDNHRHGASETMRQWAELKRRNPQAKLVCVDIQPHATTQAAEREDILNIGGFSDEVFNLLGLFANNELAAGHWVEVINQVTW